MFFDVYRWKESKNEKCVDKFETLGYNNNKRK